MVGFLFVGAHRCPSLPIVASHSFAAEGDSWGDLCQGHFQSPIDIEPKNARPSGGPSGRRAMVWSNGLAWKKLHIFWYYPWYSIIIHNLLYYDILEDSVNYQRNHNAGFSTKWEYRKYSWSNFEQNNREILWNVGEGWKWIVGCEWPRRFTDSTQLFAVANTGLRSIAMLRDPSFSIADYRS